MIVTVSTKSLCGIIIDIIETEIVISINVRYKGIMILIIIVTMEMILSLLIENYDDVSF